MVRKSLVTYAGLTVKSPWFNPPGAVVCNGSGVVFMEFACFPSAHMVFFPDALFSPTLKDKLPG